MEAAGLRRDGGSGRRYDGPKCPRRTVIVVTAPPESIPDDAPEPDVTGTPDGAVPLTEPRDGVPAPRE